MDGKIILLMISVAAVGMFVLPSTLALYAGSHDFLGAEEVECERCHSSAAGDQIAATLENGSAHALLTCKDCHYGIGGTVGGVLAVDLEGNSTRATNVVNDDVDGHAAGVTVNCIDCHSYNATGNLGTKDADGSTYYVNVSYELSQDSAAHRMVTVNTTENNGGLDDDDAVCIACHARVTVSLAGSSLGTHNASTGTIYITNGTTTTDWMYTGN